MKLLGKSFDAFSAPESYRRVDGVHPLDIYLGLDEKLRWSLLLICDQEPPALESSKMIFVYKGKRQDNRWAISLSLIDDTYKEIFLLFCSDIIDSSRHITDRKKGIKFVAQRYKEWREMLANSRNNLLSSSEVKGLLGEMYFLLHFLAPMYGVDKAALSWTGPKQLPQDFCLQRRSDGRGSGPDSRSHRADRVGIRPCRDAGGGSAEKAGRHERKGGP